jgi:POT family proton-dependent oligopeptide transporter
MTSSTGPTQATTGTIFGHPKALTYLFATEMWERFSYYGMKALLVLYMVKYLLQPDAADSVIGLATLRASLEAVFGPLGIQPFSSHIYGLYTALVYLTPVLGGLIADRLLGQHRTVILGAALMAFGHFLMAFESWFLLALLMLILGNGAFKPNISVQVGQLYPPGDPRRDRAYSIFYVGINLGAFLAPLIAGTLGETYGWHYGFLAAGIGMTIGLIVYLVATPVLPRTTPTRRETIQHAPLSTAERGRVIALLLLIAPVSLFWATYEQQANTIALFADSAIERGVNLGFARFEIPVTWFQALNPFMIFAFTPFIVALWAAQAKRGREPSSVRKMAIGCALCAASYLLLAAITLTMSGDKISWLWLVAFFVVLTTGELYLSPIGLSLVSKVAPVRLLSLLMGVWLTTNFIGNFLAGYLGSFWSSMPHTQFFILCAVITAPAGVIIWLMEGPMLRRLDAAG